MGLECLKATPWEYPAEQVDFNVSVLRNSQLGIGLWDDPLLANAKLMKDADVLKLLRSVRPYNEDGSLKTRFDMERCTNAWFAHTEASLISEDVSIKILLRLSECGNVGAPLALALNEPFLLWRFVASEAHPAVHLEEIWKLLWTDGQINKATDLLVMPLKANLVQSDAAAPARGIGGAREEEGHGAHGDGEERSQPEQEMLLKGPPEVFAESLELPEVLQRARNILHTNLGDAEIACSETARTTRLTALLYTIPSHTLLQLSRQGMMAVAAKLVKPAATQSVKSPYARSSLAALLQTCATLFGLQISWLTEADEGFPLLALCLKAAATVMATAATRQLRYSKQEQAEMRMLIAECASILESVEPGQLVVEAGEPA
eukprot:CAMPEP_0114688762 /NCGR_PEP_ID=MMETSP0191-20121206/63825_1 /TAXON_ID=126664 /ORGANISM="Sorites sp." /LENGTH=375 /DNA_ID=CAMNT_0001976615 /DNA_START=225 /DNA_END=1351 /DNA_ORIENTATION=-